uniref:Uncharacterized protein n=1 Tax=Spumella elongata TaxID=89044 RepID=A0A7S3MBB3_9STRA
MADIDTSDMLVFGACCCCNSVIWTDFPAFVGCSGTQECLCIEEKFCIKQGVDPWPCITGTAEGYICKIGAPCCTCGIKQPTILVKGKGQCCCFINNVALPPDEDTPLMFAVYGLACLPKVGCCLKLSELRGAAPAAAAPAANQS